MDATAISNRLKGKIMKTLLQVASLGVLLCLAGSVRAENAVTLAEKLSDSDATIRRNAADQLGQLGADAKPALSALIKACSDSDLYVRRFAAQALGKIGPDAKDAVPALTKLVKDEHKQVQEAAAFALGKIGGTESVKPLMAAVEDKANSSLARRKAINSLGALGADAKPAVKTLIAIVQEKPKGKKGKPADDDLRTDAVTALGAIGPDAKDAIPALKEIAEAKKGKDKNLKRAAAEALKKIEK
jgi:HEAT repeat protein